MTLLPMALDTRSTETLGTVLLFLPCSSAMLFAASTSQASPPDPAAGDHGRTALLSSGGTCPAAAAVGGPVSAGRPASPGSRSIPTRGTGSARTIRTPPRGSSSSRTGRAAQATSLCTQTAMGAAGWSGRRHRACSWRATCCRKGARDMVGHRWGLIGGLLLLACYATIVGHGHRLRRGDADE